MSDLRHLRLRYNTYFLHVKIPADLRDRLGKTFATRSLHTGDLRQARALRDVELGRLREAWERLRQEQPVGTLGWLQDSSSTLRADILAGRVDPEQADVLIGEMLDLHLKQYRRAPDGSPDVPDEALGSIRAAVRSVGRPHDTTLGDAIKSYLTEHSHLRPLTLSEKSRRLAEFRDWYGSAELIRSITRPDAARYVREVIMPKTLAPKTKRHTVGDLSTFFKWAEIGGTVDANPFYQLSGLIRETSRGKRKKERPWTTDELVKLFNSLPATDPKFQLAALALFTGMRREEIANVEVTEAVGNVIRIPEGKTESAVRDVPVHPIIQPLVDHLRKVSTDGYLLSGLKRVDVNQKRGHSIGNRFTEYKNNVLDLRDVRFHDLRSTFITALQQADVPPLTIQQLVGHKSGSVTFDTYSAGVKPARLQKEVAKVTHGRRVDRLVAEKIAELTT
jgi:integrase